MDKKQQQELQALNSEFATIIAEARNASITQAQPNTVGDVDRVALLFDPAELYGRAMPRSSDASCPDNESVTPSDFARFIRMTAAKIRTGDRSYIIESLLGQAAWLQAMALHLRDYAASVKDEGRKVKLVNLLLKMQATSAKVLASLAGISCSSRPEVR